MALDKSFKTAEVREFPMPVDVLSDHELVDAARGGDADAFAEIVRRYRHPLTNYIFRMLADYEEAVDLTQETFVRLYTALDRYHTEFAFSTYLYRIATNLAISEIRKRKRRRLFSLTGFFRNDDEADEDLPVADERPLVVDQLVSDECRHAIESAIASLPEKYRAPIVLRDIQELSYETVAEVLGLGLGTTKSRISRGRGLLREKLRPYLESGQNE